jgi:hypothetical protein
MSTTTTFHSVRDLRRRWKPKKQKLLAELSDHSTCVRLHRTFSWLQRCEAATDSADADLQLMCLWIAFNGLYGQWHQTRREPMPDRPSWQSFLTRILQLDSTGHAKAMLTAQRDLVMSILDDEYLSNYFWEEPSDLRASKSKKSKFDARTWYVEGRWGMILERVVERIYLLRCQLVHGASTFGGKLNRATLQRCVTMLQHVLQAALLVIIDHGDGEYWGDMCYPPIEGAARE